MSRHARIRARAMKLLTEGSLASSGRSRELAQWLGPLLDTGVVRQERSGAGQVLRVVHPEALSRFIADRFPQTPVPEGVEDLRLAGLAAFRDTKAIGNNTPERVALRGWKSGQLFHQGSEVDVEQATRVHGMFGFLLRHSTDYRLEGAVALVENPAVFCGFEHCRSPDTLVIYGGGRMSDALLRWLEAQTAPSLRLSHYPDYDPVGLTEHVRLKERLGERVVLHLPEGLEQLFKAHSQRRLLAPEASRRMLARLRSTGIREVARVVEWLDRYGGGLEQEALMLRPTS